MALQLHRVILVISFVFMFHFTFCKVLCVSVLCYILQVAMTFSVSNYIHLQTKRWTHRFSKHTSWWFKEWCIKPNQIPMSWSLLCMCCKEQLQLLFIVQKKYGHTLVLKIWDILYVMVNMYLACTHLYICYIYSTNRFAGHGKEKVLKLLLENGPLCHAMPLEITLSRVLMLWSRHWRQ